MRRTPIPIPILIIVGKGILNDSFTLFCAHIVSMRIGKCVALIKQKTVMKFSAVIISVCMLCGLSAIVAYGWSVASKKQTLGQREAAGLIKEWMIRSKETLETDTDRFPELLKQAEEMATNNNDPATTALLHSMIAEMYQHYYDQHRWRIDQRTPLTGYVPTDLREWSRNLFEEKIAEELSASLQPADTLQVTPTRNYQALLTLGDDSPTLRPTLFEFLAYRALEIQPSTAIYNALIAFQNQQQHTQAALLTEIDQLRFLRERGECTLAEQQAALEALYREQKAMPHAAEIVIALYEVLSQQTYHGTTEAQDSLRGEQVRLCREGIERYADYPRTVILRNYLAELERSILQVTTEPMAYPGKEAALRLHYKHLSQITVRLYESKRTPMEVAAQTHPTDNHPLGRLILTETFNLRCPNSYTSLDTLLRLHMAEPGLYECKVTAQGGLSATLPIHVSRLIAHHRDLPNQQREVWVTDRETGKPVPQAEVVYYGGKRQQLKRIGHVTTDAQGLALLPADKQLLAVQATLPNDTQGRIVPLYPIYTSRSSEKTTTRLTLFTDRGLYRPGQTLYFKGIAYTDHWENAHTIEGEEIPVILYDANHQEVAKQRFTTNAYGSFHGSFTLPQQGLSGTYQLVAGNHSHTFRVEEYKRPTFHAAIQPLQEEVAFGDTVTLTGQAKSFAGVVLPAGQVSWRILRRPFWGLRGMGGERQVAEGKTTLNAEGLFQMRFCPTKAAQATAWSNYERFELLATVTDSKGESQETTYTFSVGESSLVVLPQLTEQMEKEEAKIRIAIRTLNGESYAGTGRYQLKALQIVDPAAETVTFQEGETVLAGTFTGDEPLEASLVAQLPSGRYRLCAETTDRQGRISRNQSDFTLYSRTDKRPPYFLHTWLLKNKTECLPGEEAELIFGTSDAPAYLLYEWFQADQRIHRELVKLNRENRTFRIPFKADYGEGLMVSFTLVHQGKLYVEQIPITRRVPNRQLTIKPITFRDHLQPGSREHWRFRLTDEDSLTVAAEALASLYDASLDQILPFAWNRLPLQTPTIKAPRFTTTAHRYSDFTQQEIRYAEVPTYAYDALNWFGLLEATWASAPHNRLFSLGHARMMKSAAAAPVMADSWMVTEERAVAEEQEEEDMATAEPTRTLRTDFAETAFFYPALQTDSLGDLWIDFTLPDSHTTWKLQLLSHTKTLQQGLFTQEIVSSKPLMVTPNLPRFVRKGDQVTLSAQITNQSNAPIEGRASIELFDPATQQPVICLSKAQHPFQLQPDSMQTVAWHFTVPAITHLLGVRIVADSETATDGEQHILPILSDQLLLTESQPLYLLDSGERQIQLPGFRKGQTPYRLTLELTANPIWYAVQALATEEVTTSANCLDQLASYYTYTLATQLAQSHPKIRQLITQWQAEGGNVETLQAALNRNEELKNILLEETPWVMEAQDETVRKQRLSLLFDLNRVNNQRQLAMRQLQKLQNENGGFSWLEGFPANRAITVAVLEFLAQLTQLNAVEYNETERTMIIQALRYMDQQIEQDYEWLRRHNPQWSKALPTSGQVDYLYVRSLYRDVPEMGNALEAAKFFTRQAFANWKRFGLLHKAEIALLAHRNGDKSRTTEILNWLQKTASTSKEKGMYWANNRRETTGFVSPIWTHCRLMELFHTVAPDTQRMNQLKQWLLNQKRVQDWESTPATLNAVHLLLLTGSDWLDTTNRCIASWGEQRYDTAEGETATGYLKTNLPLEITQQAPSTLTLRKEGEAPAWGALYTQYLQPMDQVEEQGQGLHIERKLFVETVEQGTRQIRPLTEEQPLQVGDKVIVRLVIRSDQDYQYVCLKDTRAGCMEPTTSHAGYTWREGIGYYHVAKDASEQFFFEQLPQGTYVVEYSAYVTRSGDYAGGISTLQCLYAPEFVAHSAGQRIKVK